MLCFSFHYYRYTQSQQRKQAVWKAEIADLKSQVQKLACALGKEKEKKMILRVKVMENATDILRNKGIISD